jgi:hypothetical protein
MAAFNFHKRQTRRWWYAGATLVAAAAFSVFFVGGAGAFTGSPSGFEYADGNMVLDGTSANTDWNCFVGTDGFVQSGVTKPTCAKSSGASNTNIGQEAGTLANPETTWKSGQKFDTACPVTVNGSVPNKDDFVDIAEYSEFSTATNSSGGHDLYFYGAAIRQVANGNSSGNVEFNKGNTTNPGCRSDGDKLVAYDFQNGGTSLVFHVLTWITSSSEGSCFVSHDNPANGCWRDDGTPSASDVGGSSNTGVGGTTGAILGSDNGLNGADLAINQFAEFGINLTQVLGGSACFPTQTWESRSSGSSFTSNPEDIEAINYQLCGSIKIIKHTLNGAGTRSGIDQNFSYTTSGGYSPASFNLNDKNGATTGDVACAAGSGSTTGHECNNVTNSSLTPGTYSFTEGSVTNYSLTDLSCTNNSHAVTSSASGPLTISGSTASINLVAHDNWVCTYTNQQQLGAINVTKTAKNANCGGTSPPTGCSSGSAPVANAGFQIWQESNGVTGLQTTGTTPDTLVKSQQSTGSDGTACFSGLSFNDSSHPYYVHESAVPTGYGISTGSNGQDQTAVVSSNSTCSSSPVQVGVTDVPLSRITVLFHSLAGAGVTTATIECTGGLPGGDDTTFSSLPDDSTGRVLTNLVPNTNPGYTCTVKVDP